ncbi:MAG: hypothetical protein C4584_00395 [Armatimonadetes bacterium]|nr:MAG: hypothetical protein C4584_00395 [Armatimonadota bacterium]
MLDTKKGKKGKSGVDRDLVRQKEAILNEIMGEFFIIASRKGRLFDHEYPWAITHFRKEGNGGG